MMRKQNHSNPYSATGSQASKVQGNSSKSEKHVSKTGAKKGSAVINLDLPPNHLAGPSKVYSQKGKSEKSEKSGESSLTSSMASGS